MQLYSYTHIQFANRFNCYVAYHIKRPTLSQHFVPRDILRNWGWGAAKKIVRASASSPQTRPSFRRWVCRQRHGLKLMKSERKKKPIYGAYIQLTDHQLRRVAAS